MCLSECSIDNCYMYIGPSVIRVCLGNKKIKQHSTPKAVTFMYIYMYMLLCLVCLFDLACFFLSSFSSLI